MIFCCSLLGYGLGIKGLLITDFLFICNIFWTSNSLSTQVNIHVDVELMEEPNVRHYSFFRINSISNG